MKLLTKLSRHAAHAAQGVVRKKRELEQELWSDRPWDEAGKALAKATICE